MVYDCVIVGAGISGMVAANTIVEQGLSAIVVEKGRGVGGRMATRRIGEARFDHGAQFFTVSDARFRLLVNEWERLGLVKPWYQVEGGPLRYRVCPSMTGIAKALAEKVEVRRGERVESIQRVDDGWSVQGKEVVRGKRLLLTSPAPQSLELLEASAVELSDATRALLSNIEYRKTLVTMLALDAPSSLEEPGYLKMPAGGPLDVIADNQIKGSSSLPAVTIHSSHDFAEENWDRPREEVIELMTELALPHVGSKVVQADYHRWRFAHRKGESDRSFLQVEGLDLWLAGDSFSTAKVEGAVLSGLDAAGSILNHCI